MKFVDLEQRSLLLLMKRPRVTQKSIGIVIKCLALRAGDVSMLRKLAFIRLTGGDRLVIL